VPQFSSCIQRCFCLTDYYVRHATATAEYSQSKDHRSVVGSSSIRLPSSRYRWLLSSRTHRVELPSKHVIEGNIERTKRRGRQSKQLLKAFNLLTPNDHYSGRTASLTSKRCILYIYSTNIGTEYFKSTCI
jgi:hypothetical protein